MEIEILKNWFNKYKEPSLFGRYICLDHITPLLNKLSSNVEIRQIGISENDEPIQLIKLGNGPKRLLFWSQMHGNESTTTKALFDFINLITDTNLKMSNEILNGCTLFIVPILSPDGAKLYTRLNYNKVDLNRDAQNKTQKESVVLSNLINEVKPDLAFNLHGQRTIFSAGQTNNPATVSFLSPAGDSERSITYSRKIAMEVIAEMNSMLQKVIPNHVGRYDDGFNINCIGDTLEYNRIPTILFEAGHYPKDYDRETTREYIFYALVTSVTYFATSKVNGEHYKDYFLIPENGKLFYDIIIRDVILQGKNVDIAVQYTEKLIDNTVRFIPKIVKIDNLEMFYGHKEIMGEKREIYNENVTVEIVPEVELLKFYLDSELFSV